MATACSKRAGSSTSANIGSSQSPGRQRRIAFYPLGAAMALVLEETRPDWMVAYTRRPFALAALLTATR